MLPGHLGANPLSGGLSNAQQEIVPRSYNADHVVSSPPQSSHVRHFLSYLHWCRLVPRLQELQILQALRQGRRKMRCLQIDGGKVLRFA